VLKLAVEAQLPLIAVTTRDVLNLPEVIKHVTGRTPLRFEAGSNGKILHGTLYYYVVGRKSVLSHTKLYQSLVALESSLIVVNPLEPHSLYFNCGEVPVPRSMILEFLTAVTANQAKAEALLAALGGCTIKEVAEYARLTMARDKALTAPGLMLTRKTCFAGSKGLTQVDPHQGYYEPPVFLESWVERERPFFLHGIDPRLIPRGLLMDGPPGVGKTQASRYIARKFGVPLYRVDIGGVKQKWVGTSEANMLAALSQLDHEEPCVALFDEVEKVFSSGHNDSSGVTSTLLSQLLWWLAERRTRVLAVLTTNDRKKLPPELYREGRIDEVMTFNGLEVLAALAFAKRVAATFADLDVAGLAPHLSNMVKALVNDQSLGTDVPTISHAAVTKGVYDLVKEVVTPN
jgi:hypothetical protein